MAIILNGSLLEQGTKKAIAAALNRTAYDMKREFIYQIEEKYGLNALGAQYVANTRMTITRATPQKLKAVITPSRRVVPLIMFNARQDRSMPGTMVEVLRGQPQMIPHAFIPASKSGSRYISPTTKLAGVYKRIGHYDPARIPHQHITVQNGVPFTQMFRGVMPAIDAKVRPNLNINLQKEITKTMK